MKIIVTREALSEAEKKGIITKNQEEFLWDFLHTNFEISKEASKNQERESAIVKMLYYSGACIIISSMGWFLTSVWDAWNGAGLAIMALVYAIGFILIGRSFAQKSIVFSHLLYVVAVSMTPLFTYGIQKSLNVWPGNSHWVTMDLVTLAVGIIALRYIKIPFAMAIPAFVLWHISIDIGPLLFGQNDIWTYREYTSIIVGLIMIGIAFYIDRRKKIDYGKWMYIFGCMAFWGGISFLSSSSEFSRLLYFTINIILMCIGTLLERRVFVIFGSLGCIGYIGHLAYRVFRDSALFPFALTAFGVFIMFIGMYFHKHRKKINQKVFEITPRFIIDMLPKHRS
ncbi:hypothetical protein SOV_07750 [Sporomusa ovata DSM 2662]|uniref:DUF2157 domain-containing protein n=1 Tax=Sporomusa ovata TaxID=2378 RepID=A0A0U1L4W1_9FIRM|nr:hypothetical protein [Sporomusa ovata]EQB28429.1 hypothetical protein SOV_1c01130 [Sporomusa ovata DSM 2662]CQR74751.1 hypothetical protein SpAn4DRAFT_4108 [Sporomusa ovata]